ncbi:AAC(3) family N-acetyltransferase [Fulvivirgaceae bacterium BMA10]|uniref:Aminoglycoside N(3)-acetyltransferase n=1 Tax=Splendidivirga corallicola TaxID=3051826 RepID=A0ABT8KXC4_9BACT|nr:AAC(3) family N-acetyltransferase [Fulvivirgaceae bacterium BMA10]
MKAQLYYLARKIFSQELRNKLKVYQYDLKKKVAPVREKVYGNFTTGDLGKELKKKLPDNFDVLMVHSSHSAMLPMYTGNLRELLDMLLSICANDRTLVMPAFFFGERKYHYDLRKYFTDKPYFDKDKMPSQMGMITEIFRKYEGVKTSLHPTHRISALGPKADELIKDHELCKTGCGQGSPFDKMSSMKTVILGLGTKYYQCMTQTHSVEDVLIEKGTYPTTFESIDIPITLKYNGDEEFKYLLMHPDKSEYQRKLHPMVRKVLSKEDLQEWKFKGVPFFYAWAGAVQQKLIKAALDGQSAYSK